eukprot:405854_1
MGCGHASDTTPLHPGEIPFDELEVGQYYQMNKTLRWHDSVQKLIKKEHGSYIYGSYDIGFGRIELWTVTSINENDENGIKQRGKFIRSVTFRKLKQWGTFIGSKTWPFDASEVATYEGKDYEITLNKFDWHNRFATAEQIEQYCKWEGIFLSAVQVSKPEIIWEACHPKSKEFILSKKEQCGKEINNYETKEFQRMINAKNDW